MELLSPTPPRPQKHFATTGPAKSAEQRRRQQAELMQNVPQGTQIDSKLLDIATSMNLVRSCVATA